LTSSRHGGRTLGRLEVKPRHRQVQRQHAETRHS
jgi:hypothetical protein